ncbi:hypothetical protein ABFS82_09G063600 [Erythranthe guttata]
MGRTRKVAKSYSSMFVPDYPPAVEAVADSECVGTEESYALKRKFTNLNVDSYDSFGAPRQIFSLSSMSQFEMKGLEKRLKIELEQVQNLQRKIDSFTNKSSIAEHFTGNKNFPGRNGARTKGGHVTAKKTESANRNFAVLMKECETLLSRLMTHQHAWIFNEPVDIVKHNVPDYFNVIKHPMDLGTIKRKLTSRQYSDPMGFAADVRLTFKNAMTYNPPGHVVHVMTEKMSKYFETRWKPIEKKFLTVMDELKSNAVVEPESTTFAGPTRSNLKKEHCKKGMSDIEKQKLGEELEASWTELPDNILDFVKESILDERNVSDDEIEIDFDTLNDETLFTIRKLLDDYLLQKKQNQVKVEPCEIQIHNESKSSHLSSQHCKERRPVDEDVDIIGDDVRPISSCIPGENDTDAARKNSNRNSSSSSSGDSGSSSSDSGSGSSAELDIVNNSDQVASVNEMEGPIAEPKKSDGNNEDFLNRNCEQNAESNSPNCHEEVESGVPGRQVSPEKLYRAALLRGRFADIIIKAQENTVEKGADPEKLKFEKEEFERRRREEKARLQAEAEEARRKVEEEAAAEAQRKRQAEREAARQALQQMEKTVDIDESSQFMEALGVFTDQSFIQDTIPENCDENGLGGFKFPVTSNPLEQLGLYMKNEDDDDEEEEVEIERSPDTSSD